MDDQTQQKTLLNLYGLFAAAMVLSVVPFVHAALLSCVFFIVLLVMAYGARKKATAESLQENHATFIIRTLWISAFFSLITMTAATIYMLPLIDYSVLEPCSQGLMGMNEAALREAGMAEIYPLIEPCMDKFVFVNETVFINALVIAAAPLMVYMGYRFAKGLFRARKGYRLANPKSWF